MSEEWLELRPDHKGNFDELVARFEDGMVHAEMMTSGSIYIGLYWDDGRYCQTWISSKKRLKVHSEHGTGKPPRFTAQGVDTRPEDEPQP